MSLIHWWSLNGNLKDNGINNIILTNSGPTIDDNGKIGKCYYFNQNQYLYADTVNIGDEFSICYWVKYTSLVYPLTHVGIKHSNGAYSSTNKGWDIGHGPSGGGTYNFDMNDGIHIQRMSFNPSGLTELNVWKHFALVCSLSNKIVKLYINGSLVQTRDIDSSMTSFKIDRRLEIGGLYGWSLKGYLNDFRVYDNCLSSKEIKEISKALVLHYDFNDPYIETTTNIGGYASNYSNQIEGYEYVPSYWGDTRGYITYYRSGGYMNMPYKVMHRTAGAVSCGFYRKIDNDIVIESGKTYTVSCYMKCSQNVSGFSKYSFNINRGSDNAYITFGQSFSLTTEWKRLSFTFTATSSQAGNYGEMSIIYGDTSVTTNIDVYYSGFQVEVKDHATPYINGTRAAGKIFDCSGYGNDATQSGNPQIVKDSTYGIYSMKFNGASGLEASDIYIGNEWSYSCWLKPGSTNRGWEAIIILNTNGGDADMQLGLYTYPTENRIQSTANGQYNSSITFPYNNTWKMFFATFDGTTLKTYLDGELVNTKSITNTLILRHKLTIGFRYSNSSYNTYFLGNINNVKIYSTVFSADEVFAEYNRKASIDKNGNLFSGELIEDSSIIKVNKNYIVECSEFVEGSSMAKFMKTTKNININEIKEN